MLCMSIFDSSSNGSLDALANAFPEEVLGLDKKGGDLALAVLIHGKPLPREYLTCYLVLHTLALVNLYRFNGNWRFLGPCYVRVVH